MPIPKPKTAWPPKPFDVAWGEIGEWARWWEGTAATLQNYWTARQATTRTRRRWPSARRSFEQSQTGAGVPAETSITMHLPLAGDIFRLAAALLYGTPPTFKVAPVMVPDPTHNPEAETADGETQLSEPKLVPVVNEQLQDRVDVLANDDRTAALLLAHGEATAALGGGALRVVWDTDVDPDAPWIEHVDADACVPYFTFGKLTDLLFVTEYPGDDDEVLRHFECYGRGYIEHALFSGGKDDVGIRVPFERMAGMSDLAELVDEDGRIETGHAGIAAVYIPNRRPNPAWRKSQKLKMLGMSDVTNDVIPLLAAIDEVWSSLMRDVRQGKGRLIVSENLLQTLGAGQGTFLDADAEYIQQVAETLDETGRPVIEQVQFQIREGTHLTIVEALTREVLRRVGISPMTFGLTDGTVATTATEIRAHKADSITTTMGKRKLATPELADLMHALIDIDAEHFGGPGLGDDEIDVHWPPEVQTSDEEKARTVQLLADAMSLYQRVKYMHDDWTDDQIQEELERIKDDTPDPPAMDPFGFTEVPPGAPTDEPKPADDDPKDPPL